MDAAALDPARQVATEGDGVQVAGDDDALGAAEVRAGHHGVAVAIDGEVRHLAQHELDRLRQAPLVAADRLDVAQRHGESGCVQREV